MNIRRMVFILGIMLYCGFAYADTTTIVLQNGLNNYSGFEDTYNFTEFPDSNYSTDSSLLIWSCLS